MTSCKNLGVNRGSDAKNPYVMMLVALVEGFRQRRVLLLGQDLVRMDKFKHLFAYLGFCKIWFNGWWS